MRNKTKQSSNTSYIQCVASLSRINVGNRLLTDGVHQWLKIAQHIDRK